jgi:hypothetical protein
MLLLPGTRLPPAAGSPQERREVSTAFDLDTVFPGN